MTDKCGKIDKQHAALSSVYAAVFLTTMKIVVGILTGSLGIISEALHSFFDLFAAVITFFAVKISSRGADADHHFGHGKIESFSALIETALLFLTCGWIIYEAVAKIFFGKSHEIMSVHWGILVMGISIAVDISRAKMLKRAAKEHCSLALEADALHFSSDVWSSAVVILGLILSWIGSYFHLEWLNYADPVAAVVVAVIIIKVSIGLWKEAVSTLMDAAPKGLRENIERRVATVSGVMEIADIRVRPSGSTNYIDIKVGTDPSQTHRTAQDTVMEIQQAVLSEVPNSDVMVSTYPCPVRDVEDLEINQALEDIISRIPDCRNIHDIHIYRLKGDKKICADVELAKNLSLEESHKLSHEVFNKLKKAVKGVVTLNLFFECAERTRVSREITSMKPGVIRSITDIVNSNYEMLDCHDITLYSSDDKLSVFMHCGLPGNTTVDKLELVSEDLMQKIKSGVEQVEKIHIHFEPCDEKM